MRWARPSTIAVLPTPGSPMRTGLFLVRRLRTWMTRRISSSRPMTGSSLPCSASSVRSRPNFSSAWYLSSARLVGDAVGAADLADRLGAARPCVAPRGAQRVARPRRVAGEREQQVLGGDVLVLEVAHLVLGVAQDADELARRAGGLAAGGQRRQRVERGVDLARAARRASAPSLAEHGHDDAAVLLEQHGEQVLGRHLRVAAALGELAGRGDGLLGLDGESISLHKKSQSGRRQILAPSDAGARARAPAGYAPRHDRPNAKRHAPPHDDEADEPLGPATPDDETDLGDTPEAHDEISPHDLPRTIRAARRPRSTRGGEDGTTRGNT